MTQETLKLALEALELHGQQYPHMVKGYCLDAITAIKEALAQHDSVQAKPEPEQEPVAYLCENAVGHKYFRWKKPPSTYKPIALYTTPPQRTWVGLTDEEIKPCWYEACQTDLELTSQLVVYFAKAIEAKLKEKNT